MVNCLLLTGSPRVPWVVVTTVTQISRPLRRSNMYTARWNVSVGVLVAEPCIHLVLILFIEA